MSAPFEMPRPTRYMDVDITGADWSAVEQIHTIMAADLDLMFEDLVKAQNPVFLAFRAAELAAVMWMLDADTKRAVARVGLS